MTRWMAWVGLWALVLAACSHMVHTPKELLLSSRYGLVALDAEELDRSPLEGWGGWEVVTFRFQDSPYAPPGLWELDQSLEAQLAARGFELRCRTHHPFPSPQHTLRMARGG